GQVRAFLRSIRARVLSPRCAEGGNSQRRWRSFRLGYGGGRDCEAGGGLREIRPPSTETTARGSKPRLLRSSLTPTYARDRRRAANAPVARLAPPIGRRSRTPTSPGRRHATLYRHRRQWDR